MNEMDDLRLELIRSNADFHNERDELRMQMARLRLDFETYKNNCREKEAELRSQVSSLTSVMWYESVGTEAAERRKRKTQRGAESASQHKGQQPSQ